MSLHDDRVVVLLIDNQIQATFEEDLACKWEVQVKGGSGIDLGLQRQPNVYEVSFCSPF